MIEVVVVGGAKLNWHTGLALSALLVAVATCSCATRHPAPYSYATPSARPHLAWPVPNGTFSSGFGLRHGVMHEGIDIAAPSGSPVEAAAAGQVIFVGRLRGYGKVIIVAHRDHYATVYAHNSVDLVERGQWVARGQMIGRVGRTGHTTGANLHFEVRHNNVATNPLAYLSPPRTEPTRLARRLGF
ncbi:MAG TPA: M23 family metallopeptidase [Candidatus Binataceae bacterium]|nr:M23 family metallopeptidase [Candidatus Binataceae bacterium]